MKLEDVASHICIDPRKLTEYALDTTSPKGKDKAALFAKLLGFTLEDAESLRHQLETKALQSTATFQREDKYGRRYQVDIPVEGKSGQEKIVKTVWLISQDNSEAWLVTLYIKKR